MCHKQLADEQLLSGQNSPWARVFVRKPQQRSTSAKRSTAFNVVRERSTTRPSSAGGHGRVVGGLVCVCCRYLAQPHTGAKRLSATRRQFEEPATRKRQTYTENAKNKKHTSALQTFPLRSANLNLTWVVVMSWMLDVGTWSIPIPSIPIPTIFCN